MSKTIDERVVSMEFDNRQFERNVQTSMSTLEKLKRSLNLSGAAKGLETIDSSAKKISFSPLSKSVETVQAKFSALEVMAVTALANITNSAVNAGKRLASAFTIEPIKTGFQEYETQINSIQTILANTQSKGSTLENVNSALDELNKYADQTIYNFTEMTRNIGTFTAAGVDLQTSVDSIKGIANLAAVSGSSATQASTAMYQLSQAIAAGKVQLMDWNSVVNAGMGGEVFQNALKRTAEHFGTNVDAMIDKYGSFRESLTQGGWLTTEVLTETLTQLSGAYSEADLIAQGYSESQAKEIAQLAQTAVDAATKVKTFSQLFDTLKETVQSGWTQTWEILIGDFEEAKELLTGISELAGEAIGKSAEARNNMLQGWKDLGGRTSLINSIKNTLDGLSSVIKPISEAFRDIFPKTTSEQLYNMTKGLESFTEHLKISDETAAKLKSTFTGVFAVVDIFIEGLKAIGNGILDLIGHLTGLGGGLFGITGSLGDGISGFRDYIKETNLFGTVIGKVTNFLGNGIDKIKEFGNSIKESFNLQQFEGFQNFFEGIGNIAKTVGTGLVSAVSSIGSGIAKAFGGTDFFEVLNNGLFSGLLVYITKSVKKFSDSFKGISSVLENVTGILDDVRGSLQAYQDQIKAGTLLKIASAIGILAASIFVLSTIDAENLMSSLGAVTVLFAELMASMAIFGKINPISGHFGFAKMSMEMITLSTSVLILSAALKNLSSLEWEEITKGLTAIGGLMAELSAFLALGKFTSGAISTATGIVILSSSMLIFARAMSSFGSMEWVEIGKGLSAIGGLLAELSLFTNLAGMAKHVLSTGTAMVLLGASMKIFASSMKDFAGMNWEEIGRSLTAMGGALAEVAIAMNLMPLSSALSGTALIAVGAAMNVLASALDKFGAFSWEEIGKGMTVLGGALLELSIGLNLMSGTLGGSAALLIASGALAVLTPVMKALGGLSWEEIGKGLAAVAGEFVILGTAGLLLSPLIPAILGLSGALTLLGISSLAIGGGLSLIGIGLTTIAGGLTSLAASGVAGAVAIGSSLTIIVTSIADLIPTLAEKFGEALVAFSKVIGESAPQIADALLKFVAEVMNSFATYTPQIVESLLEFFIGIINGVAEHMPELISAITNLVGSLVQGIVDAFNGLNTEKLLQGITAVGLVAGMMRFLSGTALLLPGAMAGVAAVGVVIAELSLVLAAIGGLAQIPGLTWLIEEGGDLLQKLGTSIGKLVGGLVGGIAEGVTSTLPQVGTSLSDFMTNILPFIEGAKSIDPSMMDGVKALGEAILILTAADILDGLTSWITGGNSLSDFAEQLIPFGEAMSEYSKSVEGINPETITASATAAQALSELASNLPNSGGLVSLFTGNNDISDFAEQLIPFGEAMKKYSISINGMNPDAVEASATAANAIAELANNLPNTGGLVSLFTGSSSLSDFAEQLQPFGEAMKEYSTSINGMNPEAVEASATAAQTIAELANNLPNTGGLVSVFTGDNDLVNFAEQLTPFGKAMKEYSTSINGMNPDAVEASATAANAIAELANNLPNTGGLASVFTGNNDLVDFAEQLIPFGEAMKKYSTSINGMNPDAVEASANAAMALAELAENLPNEGGFVSFFTGDNDIATFGKNLEDFGEAMKKYSTSINGMNPDAVEASANAAMALAELAENLPNEGGFVSIFTGDNNIAAFGENLEDFGKAMKGYSDSIDGIEPDKISTTAEAAKTFAETIKTLSEIGTVDIKIGSFGDSLANFGEAMKAYGNAVSGVNAEEIISSATAAEALVSVAKQLIFNDIFKQLAENPTNLSSFGSQIQPFGEAMKAYSDAVSGLDTGAVQSSSSAAESLVNVAGKLIATDVLSRFAEDTTDLTSFGNQICAFGTAMKAYSDSVSGLNADDVNASSVAADAMASLLVKLTANDFFNAVSMFSGGGMNLSIFGSQLPAFGTAIKAYSDSVTGIDAGSILNSATAAKNIVDAIKNMVDLDSSGVESFVSSVNSLADANISKFVETFSSATAQMDTVGLNIVQAIASGIESNSSAVVGAASLIMTTFSDSINSWTDFCNRAGASIGDGLVNGINTTTSEFVAAGTALMSAFILSISSQKEAISGAFKSALSAAAFATRGYYRVFYSAGAYVAQGFANGISANTYAAVAKARAMASAAANAARVALDEHSPSKVFYKIGDFAGVAFVNALGAYTSLSKKAGTTIGESARDGLSNALNKVVTLLDSDMDFTPTIRPVVDLSNVQSGVNSINGMFGSGISMGALENARMIGSVMSRRNQNGGTEEVVSAINKLRSELGKIKGTSYNINGVTYDDGSNISKAVETIVRSLRIEGRA